MSAYVILDVNVINAERYQSYREAVLVAIERHGGRYLVRGGEVAVLEGIWNPERVVMIEFPGVEDARRFYESPEFLAARELRQNAAMVNMILVDGVAED
jgi:uncharacterized protein (DUF1330 family)